MSYFDRTKSDSKRPAKPRQTRAADWATAPFTSGQKTKISILQREAFEIQSEAGLVDGCFKDWKYDQTEIACGQPSLRAAKDSDFRPILAHFLRLAGRVEEAEKVWKTTGRVAGSNQVGDTHENREKARAIIRDMVANSQGLINDAYVSRCVNGRDLMDMQALELQQLVSTLGARLRAMRKKL